MVDDGLALIDAADTRIDRRDVEQRARPGTQVKVLTSSRGVGPFTALVILAEIAHLAFDSPASKRP